MDVPHRIEKFPAIHYPTTVISETAHHFLDDISNSNPENLSGQKQF